MAHTELKQTAQIARESAQLTGRVLVITDYGKRRHLKLYSDGPDDVYVRTGKRGQCVERLLTCRRICDELYEFTSGVRK